MASPPGLTKTGNTDSESAHGLESTLSTIESELTSHGEHGHVWFANIKKVFEQIIEKTQQDLGTKQKLDEIFLTNLSESLADERIHKAAMRQRERDSYFYQLNFLHEFPEAFTIEAIRSVLNTNPQLKEKVKSMIEE
jgi:hypothetical protein